MENKKPIRAAKFKNITMASSEKKTNKTKNSFVPFKSNDFKIKSQLNKKYRFDNFTKRESNQDALSTGLFVSHKQGEKLFNPLFVFGETNLGKTHLAHAIGNEIKKLFPKKKVLCIMSVFFSTKCMQAIENNHRNNFINWLQSIDIFILEDIQFLSGQTEVQELLLEVLEPFYQKEKQIIITADQLLIDLKDINSQLLYHFKNGMMVALHQSDYQPKLSFIKKYNNQI